MKQFTFTEWVGLLGLIGAVAGTAIDHIVIGVVAGVVLGVLARLVNGRSHLANP